jgi:uncharacterized protein YdeI (YjbR/CyaY-like superfamily)
MAKTTTPQKKTSAPSGPEQVAEFIKTTKHPLKKAVEEIREIILSVDKGLTEHIKWNAPSFCFNGDDRITFNLSKSDSILLIFHRGAKVKEIKSKDPLFKDTTALLQWLAPDRAVIKFQTIEEVADKKASLKKVVQQWLAAARD